MVFLFGVWLLGFCLVVVAVVVVLWGSFLGVLFGFWFFGVFCSAAYPLQEQAEIQHTVNMNIYSY